MNTASIILSPVFPLWLIILLTAGFGGLLWYSFTKCEIGFRARIMLWSMRLSAVIILAMLLCQPVWRRAHAVKEPPMLVTAVDISASMRDEVDPAQPARYERAVEFLQSSSYKRLVERYKHTQYSVGNNARRLFKQPDELVFSASRSKITAGINTIAEKLKGQHVAGIILLTDGLGDGGGEQSASAANIPLFIPELEQAFAEKTPDADIRIADVSYPEVLSAGWEAEVSLTLRRNKGEKQELPVKLFKNGRLEKSKTVLLKENQYVKRTTFTIRPTETGQHVYKLQINPEVDAKLTNNERRFLVDVTKQENRLLYLENKPRWEFKFLKRLLLSQDKLRLTAFVGMGKQSFLKFDKKNAGGNQSELPDIDRRYLSNYKAVIVGDLSLSSLDPEVWSELARFVEKGGGLLLLGGRESLQSDGLAGQEDMRGLLPAVSDPGAGMREERITVNIPPAGRAHPALKGMDQGAEFPTLLSCWTPVTVNSLSSVLLRTGAGEPLLVSRRYGEGRVAMFLTNTLWRWQLQGAADTGKTETLYERVMTQLVHWLIPEKKEMAESGRLQMVTSDNAVSLGDEVAIGAFYEGSGLDGRTDALTCTVLTPDGRRQRISLVQERLGEDFGLSNPVSGYKGVYTPEQTGSFTMEVSLPDGTQRDQQRVLVQRPYAEKTGHPIDREGLVKLAEQTGGSFFAWEEREKINEAVPFEPVEIRQVSEKPIWTHPVWLILLIVLFCTEWLLRRRRNML